MFCRYWGRTLLTQSPLLREEIAIPGEGGCIWGDVGWEDGYIFLPFAKRCSVSIVSSLWFSNRVWFSNQIGGFEGSVKGPEECFSTKDTKESHSASFSFRSTPKSLHMDRNCNHVMSCTWARVRARLCVHAQKTGRSDRDLRKSCNNNTSHVITKKEVRR